MFWTSGLLALLFLFCGLFTGKYHPKYTAQENQAKHPHAVMRSMIAAR